MTEDKKASTPLEYRVVPNTKTGLFTVFQIRQQFVADFASAALAEDYANQNNYRLSDRLAREAETSGIVPKTAKAAPSKPGPKPKKPTSAKTKVPPIPQPNGQDKEVMPHSTPVTADPPVDTPSQPDISHETVEQSHTVATPTAGGNAPGTNPASIDVNEAIKFLGAHGIEVEQVDKDEFLFGPANGMLRPLRGPETLLTRVNYVRKTLGLGPVVIEGVTVAEAAE